MLSGSRLTRGVERRIVSDRINAEGAVQAEITALAHSFAEMNDTYIAARIDDVREVGSRLIRILTQRKFQAFSQVPDGTIIIAEELTPADTALLDPRRIGGFATALGGAEGHTAIMARSLGLPAVLGVAGLMPGVKTGDRVVVDGIAGRVVINPTPATLTGYQCRQQDLARERESLKRLRDLPAVTRDGTVDRPQRQYRTAARGRRRHGLRRRRRRPAAHRIPVHEPGRPAGRGGAVRGLKNIVEGMEGRTVTVRTLDVGGEKLATSLGGHFAECANPALGLRAIRLSLREPKLLETQLAAMLRAGAHGPVRILLPMISTVSEVRKVREILTPRRP